MKLFYWSKILYLVSFLAPTFAGVFAGGLSPQLPHRLIHQFPVMTWLQSVYVRSNGDILTSTASPDASVYYVSGVVTGEPVVSLLHRFEGLNVTTAMVEYEPDVYIVIAGQQSTIGRGINGTFGMWQLDFRPTVQTNPGSPNITELVHFTEGGLCSGFDRLPHAPHILLVSDTTIGGVWRVDLRSRQLDLAIEDIHMRPLPWALTQAGITNVHIRNGYIYFTNSYEATVYRLAITEDGYAAHDGDSEVVKKVRSLFVDNFDFGPRGGDTIWAASHANNQLLAITSDGEDTVVLGTPNEMTLAGPVATMFGRLDNDTDTLYVVTDGGLLTAVNGTTVEGGKIVAVDTRPFFKSLLSDASELEDL